MIWGLNLGLNRHKPQIGIKIKIRKNDNLNPRVSVMPLIIIKFELELNAITYRFNSIIIADTKDVVKSI